MVSKTVSEFAESSQKKRSPANRVACIAEAANRELSVRHIRVSSCEPGSNSCTGLKVRCTEPERSEGSDTESANS